MRLMDAMEIRFPSAVTAVGGGGKTSLIFALALEAADLGRSALVTTTTAMFNPEMLSPEVTHPKMVGPKMMDPKMHRPDLHHWARPPFDRLVLGPASDLGPALPGPGQILLAAAGLAAQGQKLKGFDKEEVSGLICLPAADLVLVEGDGARMKPVKAPAAHEPVVPDQTRVVAGCIGLDCLGLPLDRDHVHRPEHLAALTGQDPGTPVTGRTLARLICHGQGLFKGSPRNARKVLVLNKADTPELRQKARDIIGLIPRGQGPDTWLITALSSPGSPVWATG